MQTEKQTCTHYTLIKYSAPILVAEKVIFFTYYGTEHLLCSCQIILTVILHLYRRQNNQLTYDCSNKQNWIILQLQPFYGSLDFVRDYPGQLVPDFQDFLKQETVSGSGISWAICKSAPCPREITTPAPNQSFFTGWLPFLPPNQQHQRMITYISVVQYSNSWKVAQVDR